MPSSIVSAINRRDFMCTLGAATLAATPVKTQRENPDVIIVGAGSAGCVLAHRLSANPSLRVLVLEAGGPGGDNPNLSIPGRWTSLLGTPYDWGYRTEPEAGMEDRRIAFPRGKVYGGSSAINAMTFIRGDRRCFDRWRAFGNEGWGYDEVLPLFKRLERNESGPSEVRGGDGPLAVSYCFDPHDHHRAFLAAALQNGFKADARFDFNQPVPSNTAGYYQKTILDGRRHSAADAFLRPILSRPNLEIRPNAQAVRLIVESRRVVGVEYVRDGTTREQVRAARAVVLCGGVVDSPKLLMLSGIGPADQLKALKIPVVADLPGVGRNLQDHLKLSIRWTGTNKLPGSTVTAGLFTYSSPGAAGDLPANLQFYIGRGLEQPDPFVTITIALVQPQSSGEVRLRSADPLDPPMIRGNYLQAQADVDALVRAVHLARWFGETQAYEKLKAEEVDPGPDAKTDADFAQFVRRTADTIYHPAGTCKMGPTSDKLAVVDPQLRVRGVEGLRVADGSIMPEVVNATTNAACLMIGERAADLLRV